MIENKIYNPAAQPKEWLIENFVVRTNVFEKIFKDINNGAMKYPEQHYIIQGQRGMGKTTLLLRLKYEIENTPKLNTWLLPVFFTEEMYDLTTLSNLWEKLLIYLDNQFGSTLYKETDMYIETNDYEKKCFELLIAALKSNKKKLILFFDNFGELFLDNLNDKDQHRLREVLMNCAEIRIIGASAIVLADFYNYSKPFYEFFKIINLDGLNKDETFQLIQKLEEKSEHPINLEKSKAKIETLAILTGGVIRTVMLIYEAILADQDGSALKDLETILDKITPLYKHRMEVFPPAQRKIIDVIAKKWDAMSTKEISESIRENGQLVPSKNISAQLQQLEKNNIIEKKQTNTKNNLYQLKERFFNIWYLMRHGDRYDQCRVKWLTKFLEMWYEDEKGFKGFLKEHFLHLQSGKYHASSALLISEALANSEKLDILSLDLLIKNTGEILNNEQKRLLPDIEHRKIETSKKLYSEGRYKESIEILETLNSIGTYEQILLAINYIEIDLPKTLALLESIQPKEDFDKIIVAGLFLQSGNPNKCIELIQNYKGKDIKQKTALLGKAYSKLKQNEKAIIYYKESFNTGNFMVLIPMVECLLDLKKYQEAEVYCIEGINHGYTILNIKLVDIYIFLGENDNCERALNKVKELIVSNPNNPDYMHLLGIVHYFRKEIRLAKNNLLLAHNTYVNSDNYNGNYIVNLLSILHILIEFELDKKTALKVIYSSKKIPAAPSFNLYCAFIFIWNSYLEEGYKHLLKFLNSENLADDYIEITSEIFQLLLCKNQYHSVLKIFEKEELNYKEKFKPIYYALMHYLKDEYPNEYLKMGDELKQPVADVMKRVEEMKVLYK